MERSIQLNWQKFVKEAIKRRKAQKLTQGELADLCGLSKPTIVHFEQGNTNITLSNAIKILAMLGLSDST